MLNSESLLLVLLLAACGPPDLRGPHESAGSSPDAVTPGHASDPPPTAGARHQPALLAHSLLSQRPGTSGPSSQGDSRPPLSMMRLLQRWSLWASGASSDGSRRKSSRRRRNGRLWGIRGAAADLVDAGGEHTADAATLRGNRQGISVVVRSSSRPAAPAVCSDTCHLARNGVCEDGSNIAKLALNNGIQVACDFGTDCTDCGPYRGVVPTFGINAGFKGPIDFLRRQGVKVFARRVMFEPRFVFAYTDPKMDLDVSEQIERAGCMELGIVQVFREILMERCGPFKPRPRFGTQSQPTPPPEAQAPLVVDVGANFGYFSVYAAMLGCRVVAVEPVPRFLAFLHWNMAANGIRAEGAGNFSPPAPGAPAVAPKVRVVDKIVSVLPAHNITMAVPRRGVWGTASVAGMANTIEQDLELITVGTSLLDEVVGTQSALLLKVDVEGYEPVVFKSAQKLLSERRVEHIVLEYSPGMPETLERFTPDLAAKSPIQSEDPPKMLLDIIKQGFTVVQLPDNFAKSGYGPQLQEPIPDLPQVTEKAVLYDLVDVDWFRNFSKPGAACPWPEEVTQANAASWSAGCMRAPEDSHPKGLRVTLTFNTNLWAARDPSSFKINGPVGLFAPEQDELTTWWSMRFPDQGVGNRACAFLPASQMLRSRCRCSKPEICGKEETALLKALAEGRMPRPPPPPPSSPSS